MGTATPRDFDTVNNVYSISDKGDQGKTYRVTSFNWNRTQDLLVTSLDALPLSYKRLLGTKGIKQATCEFQRPSPSKWGQVHNLSCENECFFAWEWKIIFTLKAEHLTSFWYRGLGELGNGVLSSCDQHSAYRYNVGQNKMERQTPIPTKSRMKAREGQNAPFSHPWFGGEGGLGFPFILSKIVCR